MHAYICWRAIGLGRRLCVCVRKCIAVRRHFTLLDEANLLDGLLKYRTLVRLDGQRVHIRQFSGDELG